jgi:hypothetical protein
MGDILGWILKKQERVWIETVHDTVKLHKHTLFRLSQHVITSFNATRSDRERPSSDVPYKTLKIKVQCYNLRNLCTERLMIIVFDRNM